jgi:hypothetical protein
MVVIALPFREVVSDTEFFTALIDPAYSSFYSFPFGSSLSATELMQ